MHSTYEPSTREVRFQIRSGIPVGTSVSSGSSKVAAWATDGPPTAMDPTGTSTVAACATGEAPATVAIDRAAAPINFAYTFKVPSRTKIKMNSTSDNAILQLLKQAASNIDSSHFPITATFIQRLETLSEQYPNEDGTINSDRLALSLITMIGALEERSNYLEEKLQAAVPKR